MNKSNPAVLPLSHEQASRLVQLFAPSFDACLQGSGLNNGGASFVWHPVLTDIHLQVVHALSPVLVEPHQRLGDSSPTLSLSLLPASNAAAQLQVEQELQHIPDSLTLPVKPAL